MSCGPEPTDPINSYALVGYIPGRLGEFLDELRRELVCGCIAQSHVTVLPPRELSVPYPLAQDELRMRIPQFSPFRIEVPGLHIFEETSVVYADIGAGRDRLLWMHDDLNSGHLRHKERYDFHPHITLAHGAGADEIHDIFETATRRWKEAAPAHSFLLEKLTFVQNTESNRWLDLERFYLRGLGELKLG